VLSYQEAGLFTGATMRGGISYYDILRDLTKMNAAMKFFISVQSTAALSSGKYPALFNVSFDPAVLSELKIDYAPVRGFSPCNPVFQKLQSGTKNAATSMVSATKDAGSQIANASKRLANAFVKTTGISKLTTKKKNLSEEYFSEAELQQLRTIYGINTTKMTSKDAVNLKNLLKIGPNIKKSWNNSLKKSQPLREGTKKLVSSR
jgi:hypothetical protein